MTEVFELRRYTLHPGRRDDLISLFDAEFVETQEAEGIRVLGQFRDLADDDQFVWMRSFPDMAVRASACTAFYTSDTWLSHRDAANDTMIAVDNVLLLRAAVSPSLDSAVRDTAASSVVEVVIYFFAAPPDDTLLAYFTETILPTHAAPLALLHTEYADNNFPALPVRTGEHVVVTVSSLPGPEAPHPARPEPPGTLSTERLLLAPTARSLLR